MVCFTDLVASSETKYKLGYSLDFVLAGATIVNLFILAVFEIRT